MATVKHTKNELKQQRDALARFQRYLPTLVLKKQQLQLERKRCEETLRVKLDEIIRLNEEISSWVALFSSPMDLTPYLQLNSIREREENIAGVTVPVVEEIHFDRKPPDLALTPAWTDPGLEALETFTRLWIEIHAIREEFRRMDEELRITTQRVNLFEKVKIPGCKEYIREIRIFLGDLQTAEVARAKLAKSKTAAAGAAA